jgi:UDP-2-acetamido-3-amino-2,3-dideoxy-glucuronate N-acetyltransferase
MVGMGSVVTHDVPDFGIVVGNPARAAGHACACGQTLTSGAYPIKGVDLRCEACDARYMLDGLTVVEVAAVR